VRRQKVHARFQEKRTAESRFEFANAEQREFVLSTARETLADGGVGSGKTLGGIMRLLLLAEAYPHSRYFIARQYYKDLMQTTRKSFNRICPAGWVIRDVSSEMTLFNGSEIIWAHLDEYDIKTLMGLEINGAFLDQVEEISIEMYETLDSRCGRWYHPSWEETMCPAYIWSTSNPNGKDAYYFRFHPDCDPPDYRKYIFMPTGINREVLDKFHPGYYDNLMRKSPTWRKRWVEASRDIWEGQIFTDFHRDIHVYDKKEFNPFKVFPLGSAWAWMDYGLTKPTTLALTYSATDYLFFTAEYGASDKTIKQHSVAIKELIARNPAHVRGIFADPSMFFESNRDRKVMSASLAREYRTEGIYLLKADNNEESSIEILHEMFNIRKDKMNPTTGRLGSPTLFIEKDCVNLMKEIEGQSWQEERNPLTGEKEFIGVRKARVADDYYDLARYFANSKVHQVTAKRPQMATPSYGWTEKKPGAYAAH
jgi:hypothetical protein